MRRRSLLLLMALAGTLAIAAPAAGVTAPKSGAKYSGKTEQGHAIDVLIRGKSVEYVSFRFNCGRKAIGATGLQDIPLERTSKGYRFELAAHASMSFSDEEPDENGAVFIRGRFSRTARSVKGLVRVKSDRCHDTGYIRWRAKR